MNVYDIAMYIPGPFNDRPNPRAMACRVGNTGRTMGGRWDQRKRDGGAERPHRKETSRGWSVAAGGVLADARSASCREGVYF